MEQVIITKKCKMEDGEFTFTSASSSALAEEQEDVAFAPAKVLVSGGLAVDHKESCGTEIYDYESNSVRKGPKMRVGRCRHATVALGNGDVGVFGGVGMENCDRLSFCEVLDRKSMCFYDIGNMSELRDSPAAVFLPKRNLVFIVGGFDGSECLRTCEFYSPATRTFYASRAKMSVGRTGHTASLLPDGKVIVCGGTSGCSSHITTEIYDPETDSFSAGPVMNMAKCKHTAVNLRDGRVLLLGSDDSCSAIELYTPATNSFVRGPQLPIKRNIHFAALLPNGKVYIGGGYWEENCRSTSVYDPDRNVLQYACDMFLPKIEASACIF